MMKKILILGGSHRDIPLIEAAKELGYYVITLGNKDYYLGHNYADKYYKINFNDLDEVKNIIKKENITYLLPGSSEESYLNTVLLSHELGIGNFDTLKTAQLIHNKWKFKDFCLQHGISTPNGSYYKDNGKLNDYKYPIVVKPTNLSGGRGVQVVNTEKELIESIQETKKVTSEIFLEEYIDGQLIAYSILLKEQKIVYGFTGADDTYLNKYLITTAYPIKLNKIVLERLKNDIHKLAKLLHLVDGMFHLQIIIKNNIPYIIDVTRRIPGDLYPNLIEYCDKINYSKNVVNSYTNGIINNKFNNTIKSAFVIRHCVMPSNNGIYQDISINNKLKNNIIKRFDLVNSGYKVTNYLHTQISILFIKLNYEDYSIISEINNLIYPIMTDKDNIQRNKHV